LPVAIPCRKEIPARVVDVEVFSRYNVLVLRDPKHVKLSTVVK